MKIAKSLISLFLSCALLAAAPVFAADAAKPDPRSVVTENKSPYAFADTVSRLKAQLQKDGWNLLSEIDLGARIAKKGVNLPGGLVILELTSGGSTIPLLKNESTRYVAGLMPCSVSVYGLDNGEVVVSRMNANLMLGMMEPRLAEVLGKSIAKLDASVAAALGQ